MKTTIKTLSYLLTLSLAIIIASCEDKQCQADLKTTIKRADSLQAIVNTIPQEVKAIPNCLTVSPFPMAPNQFRVDFDYENNTIVIYDRSPLPAKPEKVHCTCDVSANKKLMLQVASLTSTKYLSINTFTTLPTSGYTKKSIVKNNVNDLLVDIVLNNLWKPGTTSTDVFRIIGTEDDRNGVVNANFVIANLEGGAPVYLEYKPAVAGGANKTYDFHAQTTPSLSGMPAPSVIKESVKIADAIKDKQIPTP